MRPWACRKIGCLLLDHYLRPDRRAHYVLFRLDYYLAHPDQIIQIWHAGCLPTGPSLLGTATIIYVARRYCTTLIPTLMWQR